MGMARPVNRLPVFFERARRAGQDIRGAGASVEVYTETVLLDAGRLDGGTRHPVGELVLPALPQKLRQVDVSLGALG
jgi:hypothetical protein